MKQLTTDYKPNTRVYVYISLIDGTHFITNTRITKSNSKLYQEYGDWYKYCIKNKPELNAYIEDWQDIFDNNYLQCLKRQIKNIMYDENK